VRLSYPAAIGWQDSLPPAPGLSAADAVWSVDPWPRLGGLA